ncbi:MAG: sugar phosphate isomerase/epimerase family protein [Fusobacteriaceae bacterium]
MELQNFEFKNEKIKEIFLKLKHKIDLNKKIKLSWSNWGFGLEKLETSLERLKKNGMSYIELHGNLYGDDLGYSYEEVNKLLEKYQIKVSGVCGMFSKHNDLSSNNPFQRQKAIDYLKRQIKFTAQVGGHYLLVVPAAVGRPIAYDDCEIDRSIETLGSVAHLFKENNIKAAIEPIRAAETSIIHTVEEAIEYIGKLNREEIQSINGDVYHMQSGENHIGEAIIKAGYRLVNLHMADSNRTALGDGSLDLDTIIMALYILKYNESERFVSFEPLGPGGDPYPAMNGKNNPKQLDELVEKSIRYFREREEYILKLLEI